MLVSSFCDFLGRPVNKNDFRIDSEPVVTDANRVSVILSCDGSPVIIISNPIYLDSLPFDNCSDEG